MNLTLGQDVKVRVRHSFPYRLLSWRNVNLRLMVAAITTSHTEEISVCRRRYERQNLRSKESPDDLV